MIILGVPKNPEDYFIADDAHGVLGAVVVDLALEGNGKPFILQKACHIHLHHSR